jgi:CRISPR-associated protein Cas1
MTSLYVDRRGVELKLDGGAIAFYENAERIGTVPVAPLERIFLRGDVTLHSSLLGKLGEKGIGLIVLSGRRGEPSLMLARPHNDAARRVAQYQLSQSTSFCLRIARGLVAAKLCEAEKFLQELQQNSHAPRHTLHKACRQLGMYADHVSNQSTTAALRGLEGRAAASYFEALAAYLPVSLEFSGRNRRPPRDPVNALLSLSYTLLHADIVLALYGGGLDPYIGFYHELSFGRESLASDMIEPLRPLVDRFVVNVFSTRQLRPENFSKTDQGCLLGKAGRARFYPLYEEAAENFRKRITQSVTDLVTLLKQRGVADGCIPAEVANTDAEKDSQYPHMPENASNDGDT